jgi:hypothetical protein
MLTHAHASTYARTLALNPVPPHATPLQVELLANNASSMSSIFANHGDHIIADKILTVQDVRLHTQNQSLRLSRGSFKVLNQLAAFPRLQVRVGIHSRAGDNRPPCLSLCYCLRMHGIMCVGYC